MELRAAKKKDLDEIITCILASGLFTADEVGAVKEMFESRESSQIWLVAERDNTVVGVSYAGPLEVTDRTWNLWMLAVHSHQRMGIASRLVAATEKQLQEEKQRLLIIETTQKDDQIGARALYRKLDYQQVSQIPDFYEDGSDKITFTKRLS